jgi:hypothetical protein
VVHVDKLKVTIARLNAKMFSIFVARLYFMYLNCKTYFSYRYGTLGTEELVTLAAENGANALALTNINNTSDVWDFVDFCGQQGIKPIAGVEVRNTMDDSAPGSEKLLYLLLARDNYGLMEMNRWLTQHLQAKQPFPAQPAFSEHVWIIFPFGHKPPDQLALNELLGVAPAEINKLYGFPVAKYAHKMVIRHPVTFKNKTYYNLHRLLRAIDQNTLLSKLIPFTPRPHTKCGCHLRAARSFSAIPRHCNQYAAGNGELPYQYGL